jgi:hypothetical protein
MNEYIKTFIEQHESLLDNFEELLVQMLQDEGATNTKANLCEIYNIFKESGIDVKQDASRFLYRYIKRDLHDYNLYLPLDVYFNRLPRFDFTSEELRSILDDVIYDHYDDCYSILKTDKGLYLDNYSEREQEDDEDYDF